ncbi:MAG: 3-deoxy-7-phosphoheptulonate synthase, partial [Gammaproteobacteria bacterium]|nr:3-deoxy-7-phosphoheptulonate synthase [Gammaproteobacteria bacterium]MBU1833034.1 3-deoxy-7-phosphoheptulonate synthase [Gammaproteobacteria bacterium]
MSNTVIENVNVDAQEILITPAALKAALPMSDAAKEVISRGRETVRNILDGKDHRMFVVVGPCSIHDVDAAMDYAHRLKALADEVSDTLVIIMRVYFEKPRTTVGWKGLINDPYLNDTFKIEEGLHIGRKLLLDISE